MQRIKAKKLTLGIVGGGPNSWIGHVHRISSRFDDQYEIIAGVFSRNAKISKKFGKNLGISPDRCYSNYKEMADKEEKRKDDRGPNDLERVIDKLKKKIIEMK